MILSRDSYEALLMEIPKYMGNYLEIGVYEGDMLKDFAERWSEKTFYGIDPFLSDPDTIGHHGVPVGETLHEQKYKAYENWKGINNITFFETTSKRFLETMDQDTLDEMKVSVVYVDGSHSYDDTLTDLTLAGKCIRQGLIYVDDSGLPEVAMAMHYFMGFNHDRIVEYKDHKILLRA